MVVPGKRKSVGRPSPASAAAAAPTAADQQQQTKKRKTKQTLQKEDTPEESAVATEETDEADPADDMEALGESSCRRRAATQAHSAAPHRLARDHRSVRVMHGA